MPRPRKPTQLHLVMNTYSPRGNVLLTVYCQALFVKRIEEVAPGRHHDHALRMIAEYRVSPQREQHPALSGPG